MSGVLRTQLSGVARRPARLLLTGLAMLVASFVVYATVLAQQITVRTVLSQLSGTPAAVDLVVAENVTAPELARIRALPGVAEATGRVEVGAQAGGQYLNLLGDPGSGPLATVHPVSGRYPSGPDEIAVTARTADRLGMPIGTAVSMTTRWDDHGKALPPTTLHVVGVVKNVDDRGDTAYAPQPAVTALAGDPTLQQIDVRVAAGTSVATVRSELDAYAGTVTPRPKIDTGAHVRLTEAQEAVSGINSLFAVVAMFVAIAVVAAGLVATSTFRIVFAQRMRQLALLRTVGAGRGSITRALAAEGTLTGLVAGTAGVLAALAVGYLAPPLAHAAGLSLVAPGIPVPAALGTVALSVFVTLLAVLAPAVSAARVSPLEALRASSTTAGKRGIGGARWVGGLLLTAGAGVLAAYVIAKVPGSERPQDYSPLPMLLALVASGAFAFFALIALGPVLVRPVLAGLGWPLRRLGPVGRLAVGGVGGAPRRAAAVSVVVALGVTLIAGMIVGAASLRVLGDRELAISAPADYEVTTADGGPGLAPALADKAATRPELTRVTPYRRLTDITAGTSATKFEANDLALSALPPLANLDVAAGSLRGLGPGKMVVSRFTRDNAGLGVGDKVALRAGKRTVTVTVAAVLPDTAPLGSGMILSAADLTALGAPATYSGLLVDSARAGEAGRTAGQKALQQVIAGTSGAGIDVLADHRDEVNSGLDMVLAIGLGLVGLTVLIAVVGVGTTSALSVVERTRESGLLRAVGLSKAGLRVMLTTEASLYGVLGAAIGLALGVPYGWLAIKALALNMPLSLPVGQLALVFVALVAFTALAGVLPARRAARVSPVAALATDA